MQLLLKIVGSPRAILLPYSFMILERPVYLCHSSAEKLTARMHEKHKFDSLHFIRRVTQLHEQTKRMAWCECRLEQMPQRAKSLAAGCDGCLASSCFAVASDTRLYVGRIRQCTPNSTDGCHRACFWSSLVDVRMIHKQDGGKRRQLLLGLLCTRQVKLPVIHVVTWQTPSG